MDAGTRVALVARLRAMGASPADAEDCVQEALLEAWSGTSAPASPMAWLTVVARNKYVDLVRRRARETSAGLVPAERVDRTAVGPEERVVGWVHAGWLVGRLGSLPPVTREVCLLAAQGTGRAEVAAALGLSARSVESHLTRARRFLRLKGALGAVTVATAAVWRRWFPVGWQAATVAVAAAASLVLLPDAVDGVQPAGPARPATVALPPPSSSDAPPTDVSTAAPTSSPIPPPIADAGPLPPSPEPPSPDVPLPVTDLALPDLPVLVEVDVHCGLGDPVPVPALDAVAFPSVAVTGLGDSGRSCR